MFRFRTCDGLWRVALQLGLFEEVIVGTEVGVAIVFVGRAMKVVGAALGDEVDLRAARTAGIGFGIARGDAKLFEQSPELPGGRTGRRSRPWG